MGGWVDGEWDVVRCLRPSEEEGLALRCEGAAGLPQRPRRVLPAYQKQRAIARGHGLGGHSDVNGPWTLGGPAALEQPWA